jgi:hypothetical protein
LMRAYLFLSYFVASFVERFASQIPEAMTAEAKFATIMQAGGVANPLTSEAVIANISAGKAGLNAKLNGIDRGIVPDMATLYAEMAAGVENLVHEVIRRSPAAHTVLEFEVVCHAAMEAVTYRARFKPRYSGLMAQEFYRKAFAQYVMASMGVQLRGNQAAPPAPLGAGTLPPQGPMAGQPIPAPAPMPVPPPPLPAAQTPRALPSGWDIVVRYLSRVRLHPVTLMLSVSCTLAALAFSWWLLASMCLGAVAMLAAEQISHVGRWAQAATASAATALMAAAVEMQWWPIALVAAVVAVACMVGAIFQDHMRHWAPPVAAEPAREDQATAFPPNGWNPAAAAWDPGRVATWATAQPPAWAGGAGWGDEWNYGNEDEESPIENSLTAFVNPGNASGPVSNTFMQQVGQHGHSPWANAMGTTPGVGTAPPGLPMPAPRPPTAAAFTGIGATAAQGAMTDSEMQAMASTDRWAPMPSNIRRAALEIYQKIRSAGCANVREWVDKNWVEASIHKTHLFHQAATIDTRLSEYLRSGGAPAMVQGLQSDDILEGLLRMLASSKFYHDTGDAAGANRLLAFKTANDGIVPQWLEDDANIHSQNKFKQEQRLKGKRGGGTGGSEETTVKRRPTTKGKGEGKKGKGEGQ